MADIVIIDDNLVREFCVVRKGLKNVNAILSMFEHQNEDCYRTIPKETVAYCNYEVHV